MTATATPTPPPAPTGPAPGASRPGGLASLENALGGPQRATMAGGAVLVVLFVLYQKHKAKTAAANTVSTPATTDTQLSPEEVADFLALYEQQLQGQNPFPVPTSPGTPPPVAPHPPIVYGGNPPRGPYLPIPGPQQPTAGIVAGNQLASPSSGTYTVQPGDNLWGVAARAGGNSTQWPGIYAANQQSIGANPNHLTPGARLSV